MNTVFNYENEAKNNPNINTEIIAATENFQKILRISGVGKKVSYKIDRPSDQRKENSKVLRNPKIVMRVF